ncbi:MAG: TerB family tellurite resistance protein [Myxococcales bacterium]|nr:TerB family tellurite resistance protein [Myxococcales bacterium]
MEHADKILLLKLAVKVIKADGLVKLAETDYLSELVAREGIETSEAVAALNSAMVEHTADLVAQLAESHSQAAILNSLVATMYADRVVDPAERALLDSIAEEIGFPVEKLEGLVDAHRQ